MPFKAISADTDYWSDFLYRGVAINPKCKITYGENVKIDPLVSIGFDGFGFERDGEGYKIPITRREHTFGVVIGDNVEIGSQSVIHRGRWRDTVIGEGTKIDSLVHVAHNAHIGKHCLVVAGTVIGGSVTIGDHCFIGENVSIKQGVKIADHVTIGMGAVVLHDITESNTTWAGNPVRKISDVQKF
jgi:UDP-3-O-[3-hydroxymyristoyl] glucosamine N-acyltransferase